MSDLQLKLYGEQIAPLLEPGERLLAITQFLLAPGKILVERPPDPPDSRSGLRKVTETAAGTAVFLIDGPRSPSLNRMLGVVSAAGDAGSWAARLLAARPGSPNRTSHLVVTDARLLLVGRKIFGKEPDYSVDLVIPRSALTNASRLGRPFARGRVVIEFSDGSMVALKLGGALTGPARRLVQALSAPGAPPAS